MTKIYRSKDGLESLCIIGMMNGRRERGRPKKSYTDNLIEITRRNHSFAELRRMRKDRSL